MHSHLHKFRYLYSKQMNMSKSFLKGHEKGTQIYFIDD